MFAACGIIPAFKMAKRGRKPKERKGYFYESEEDAIVRFIQENDEIRFANDNEHFGTIIKDSQGISDNVLSITPAFETFTENGKAFPVFYPEDTRVNAVGTMRCEGTYSDNGIFLINGSRSVSSGENILVHTDEVTVTICIISINPV